MVSQLNVNLRGRWTCVLQRSDGGAQLKRMAQSYAIRMESMYENQVWNLVDPPEGVKPIQCKWIFKRKIDPDGNPTIYKARLVEKGFLQIEGVCILKFPIFEIRNNFRKNHRSSTKEDRYKIIKTCGRPGNLNMLTRMMLLRTLWELLVNAWCTQLH